MSEGPQTRRRAEWLRHVLEGRRADAVRVQRPHLEYVPELLAGRRVLRVFPHGKHIFLEFDGDLFLHNHLLMRGTWSRSRGQLLFLRPDAWLAMSAGGDTVCNLRGQMLQLEDGDAVTASLAALGPDLMAEPFPRGKIEAALRASPLPIGEALLDQSVVAGAGNVARCEALFLARVDPRVAGADLAAPDLAELVTTLHAVMWESYRNNGRWVHRVYGKRAGACPRCGAEVRALRLAPSRRRLWFCPACQGAATPDRELPFGGERSGEESEPRRA